MFYFCTILKFNTTIHTMLSYNIITSLTHVFGINFILNFLYKYINCYFIFILTLTTCLVLQGESSQYSSISDNTSIVIM